MKSLLPALRPLLPGLAVVLSTLAVASCATSRQRAGGGDVRTAPREPWREARPAAGPAPALALPVIQRAELKNGLSLLLIEEHSLPTVDAAVVVRAGAVLDGREAGLAHLTWDLLDEGAGGLNAAGLANAFADIGTTVSAEGGREQGGVHARFLKKNADRGLELLALVVQKPAFAQADFDRVKKLHLDALKAKEGEPATIAWQALAARAYGADHPYGQPFDGTTATVEKLRPSSVKRFWSELAGPKAAAIVLVGDMTLDEAKALAEKHFGKWRGSAKSVKAPATPKARARTEIVVVDFPGAPQTMIRFGRALLPAGDPDEPAMVLLNQVLGGMFSSRLNLKLREEKQWTYGAFSSIDTRLGAGPFVVGADVQTPNTIDAVAEILAQIDALKTGGPSAEELALARTSYVKTLPGLFALPPQQVGVASELFALGLPLDHHAALVAAVGAATPEAVKAAGERALVKEDFVVVLVGDRATIEAGLKDKDLGAVTFLNKDLTPAK